MNIGEFRYDIKGLAEELEVEMKDIAKLYLNYFEEMNSEISEMNDFISGKNWMMLQKVIHNVKGVSANLNVYDVFEEAAAFDALLKAGSIENAQAHVNRIIALIKVAEAEMKEYFKRKEFDI